MRSCQADVETELSDGPDWTEPLPTSASRAEGPSRSTAPPHGVAVLLCAAKPAEVPAAAPSPRAPAFDEARPWTANSSNESCPKGSESASLPSASNIEL